MEFLISNVTAARARKAELHGREYLVAPLSMIVPGVLNGSRGPGLYPLEEIRRNPWAWNGIPIVVYHPTKGGTNVSARDPDIINSQGVGSIYKANVNGKLTAEGWFDVEALKRVDAKLSANARILPRLESGEPIELSTGLDLDPDPASGEFEGKQYDFIARNYRPDHLAILPDQVGACSLQDGCGVLVNGKYDLRLVTNVILEQKETIMALTAEQRTELIDSLIENCDCWEDGDREVLNSFPDEKLQSLNEVVENAMSAKDKKAALAEMSDEEIEAENKKRMAGKVKNEERPEPPKSAEDWLKLAPEEVRNTFRYAHDIEQREKDKLVEQLTANLEGSEKQVHMERLQTRSLDDLRADVALLPKKQEPAPTANEGKEDAEWLKGIMSAASRSTGDFDDKPLMPPTMDFRNTEGEESVPEVTSSLRTSDGEEEWLRKAPARMRTVIENALKVEQRERKDIVNQLTANIESSAERFRLSERLMEKPLEELRDLLALRGAEVAKKPKPTYMGAAAPATNRTADADDILPLPTLDFERKQA